MRGRLAFVILGMLGLALLSDVRAQIVTLSGSAGVYGEVYAMQGREGRRDPSLGRFYIRPTLRALGMDFPFEVYVSSEETRFRQPFNRFGIDPSWRWVTLHLGDFYPRLGTYVGGIRMRGVGIDLRPGIFRLSALRGRTQRAVPGVAFERNLWAVMVGLGREQGSYLDVGLMMATDDTSSLADSAAAGVNPQQNLLMITRAQVNLFRRRFRMFVEAAGGLHTRDLRSATADSVVRDQLPPSLRKVYNSLARSFEPRLSTRADYALRVELQLRTRRFQISGRTSRVGPGFVSLGMPYTVNDRKKSDVRALLRLIPGKATLSGNYTVYRDNLENDKETTTGRTSWKGQLQLRPIRSTTVSLNYGGGVVVREDSLRVEFEGLRYGLQFLQRFRLMGRSNRFQLTYTRQKSERWQGEYDVGNLTTRWDVQWSRTLGANLVVGSASNRYRGERSSILITGAGLRSRALGGRLVGQLSLRVRSGKEYTSVATHMSLRWNLSRADALVFRLRRTDYSRPDESYHETLASLSFDHRFGR